MKIDFLPFQRKVGSKYILRPQHDQEMRLLSIWRDLSLGKDVYFKVVAAESLDQNKPGMPAKPVTGLCLVPYTRDQKGNEVPYHPVEDENVDPLVPCRTRNVGVGSGRKTRVVAQPDGRSIEES